MVKSTLDCPMDCSTAYTGPAAQNYALHAWSLILYYKTMLIVNTIAYYFYSDSDYH